MNIFKTVFLSACVFLIGCGPKETAKPVIIEETVSIIDQVSEAIKEDKATVIGFFVKPQRSTSCQEMYVEISVFNESLNQWEAAIEFNIEKNSKEAIGGPSMDNQLFLASLNRLEEFAISGVGCQPYQGKMSKNYQIYATFKPEYGKINIIGNIEQNILAKGVNIYDFKDNTEAARTIIAAENPSLESYVTPVDLDVKLWNKLEGKALTPAEIMADKNGAKTFILYQLDLQKRVDHIKNSTESLLNHVSKGTYKMESAIKVRKIGLDTLDKQREDIYRFYDMLSAGTSIKDAAVFTELMTGHRGVGLENELGSLTGISSITTLSIYADPLNKLKKSGRLKGLNNKPRLAELKQREPLRDAVTETEGPYLKAMYPFSKLRSVKSRDKQVELTKAYLEALDKLEIFDAKRHVKRAALSETNGTVYMTLHEDMIKARRDYLIDFAERVHEEDYLGSKNYHKFKTSYSKSQEQIKRLNVELFSAL